MRPLLRISVLVSAALCAGCGPAPSVPAPGPLLLTAEETARAAPDRPGAVRPRSLERTPRANVSLLEQPSGRTVGLRKNYHADVRILVLSGQLKVRLGGREGSAGAGAFLSIPRGVQYRLAAAGGAPARYVRIVTPDVERETVFEAPR